MCVCEKERENERETGLLYEIAGLKLTFSMNAQMDNRELVSRQFNTKFRFLLCRFRRIRLICTSQTLHSGLCGRAMSVKNQKSVLCRAARVCFWGSERLMLYV